MQTATTTDSETNPPTRGQQRLAPPKNQIAIDDYEVDPKRVADAIITKLRLVRRAHQALAARQAGRSRPQAGPGPADR